MRSELVKLKGVPKKVNETATANNEHAWKYCALSRAPLSEPLASDALGRIFNKESIIRYILDRDAFGDVSKEIPHINSLKDVVELKIGKSDGKFICEVTRRDMNGQTKFVYPSTCGHVFAAEALKSIDAHECLICSARYEDSNIIPLNPSVKDIEKLQDRLAALNDAELTHSGSLAKRKKKRKALTSAGSQEKHEKSQKMTINSTHSHLAPDATPRSSVLSSLLHKSDDRVASDGFMTRGTSSRVG